MLVAAVPVHAHEGHTDRTWDNLEERLEANRAAGTAPRVDTIFGIGSTPVGLTHVGILMLVEQGTRGSIERKRCAGS
jgi:hypothetical protein